MVALLALQSALMAAQEAPAEAAEALRHGRLILDLRLRYNRIDESDKPELTEGFTTRTVAGWRTAPWHGWRATLEGIHTDHIGPKRFNDDGALFFTSRYPLLPDPRYTGVNEAHLDGEVSGLRLRLGRQRLRIDNQRWVSDNDFRNIPQLFDGALATYEGFERAQLMAGHFGRVRNTSGQTQDLRLTLLHAAWNPLTGHALAAYGFFHDQAQNGAFTGFADSSYKVAGVRAEGSFPKGALRLSYVLDAARQRPYASGDSRIDAPYWRAGVGAGFEGYELRYDQEVKGSNDGRYGVQMPLTDFYAFNGWTLHFYNTPAQGLRDRWLTARAAWGSFAFIAEAHRFRSDFAGLDFGRETDLGVTWQFHPDASLRLQHARYDPGSGGIGAHVRKTWITLGYGY